MVITFYNVMYSSDDTHSECTAPTDEMSALRNGAMLAALKRFASKKLGSSKSSDELISSEGRGAEPALEPSSVVVAPSSILLDAPELVANIRHRLDVSEAHNAAIRARLEEMKTQRSRQQEELEALRLKLRQLTLAGSAREESEMPEVPASEMPEVVSAVKLELEGEQKRGVCTFFVLSASFVLSYRDGETLPDFQALRRAHPEALQALTCSEMKAYRGEYTHKYLAISHRWEHQDQPDSKGVQAQAVKEYLRKHPEIEGVWYDYWSMPQGERTLVEKLRFKWMLSNVNLLYLGMRVLVLCDISTLSRFWTQFEAWLALQAGSPEGLHPASKARRRVEIVCLHNATWNTEGKKLLEMWERKAPNEAYDTLAQPDVTVTNASDKTVQLQKIEKLNAAVRSAWGVEAAALTLADGVTADGLPVGFLNEDLLRAGYTAADVCARHVKLLQDRDGKVRKDAKDALSQVDAAVKAAVLEELGLKAEAFEPDVLKAVVRLEDHFAGVRTRAAKLLAEKLSDPRALKTHVESIVPLLEDPHPDVRYAAVDALEPLFRNGLLTERHASKFENAAKMLEDSRNLTTRCESIVNDEQTWKGLERLLETDSERLVVGGRDRSGGEHNKLTLKAAWRVCSSFQSDKYERVVDEVRNELQNILHKHKKPFPRSEPIRTHRTAREYTSLLGKDGLSETANEALLFHVPSYDGIKHILFGGLNERFAGSIHGAAFGDGIYFAEDAGKSDQYAQSDMLSPEAQQLLAKLLYKSPNPSRPATADGSLFYVLVCRVCLGFPARTQYAECNSMDERDECGRPIPIFTGTRRELGRVPRTGGKHRYHSLYAELLPPRPSASDDDDPVASTTKCEAVAQGGVTRYREFMLTHGEQAKVEFLLAYEREYDKDAKPPFSIRKSNSSLSESTEH